MTTFLCSCSCSSCSCSCFCFCSFFFFFFFFIFFFFFLAYSQRSQIGCLPHFHTSYGLSATLEYRSEMCKRLAGNTGRKNSPSAHYRTTLSGYIFATNAFIDNRQKIVKQPYLRPTSSQYVELRPANDWDLLASLGHPSKFQRVSRLGFVTAPTSLNGGQPNLINNTQQRALPIFSWAAITLDIRPLLVSYFIVLYTVLLVGYC